MSELLAGGVERHIVHPPLEMDMVKIPYLPPLPFCPHSLATPT